MLGNRKILLVILDKICKNKINFRKKILGQKHKNFKITGSCKISDFFNGDSETFACAEMKIIC